MLVLDSITNLLYYGMTAFFGFILCRNLWKTRDPQEAVLCSVILIPFVLRLLRLK